MDELNLGGGTAAEVSSGANTEVAEVTSSNIDIASAVDSIGDSLGFGKGEETQKEVNPLPERAEKPAVESTPASVAPASVAPKTWKPEEASTWAGIPPAAQAAILRREEDMFRGIEQHKQTAAFGASLQAVFQPYEQLMRAHNIDPVQNTANLMQAHYVLATGSPSEKSQLFAKLASDYRIDLTALAGGSTDDAYSDPQVRRLEEELAQLRSGQASLQEARYQEVKSKTQTEVNTFAADPANIYFDELSDDIVRLLNQDKQMTLQKAYETAVWTNPVTRAKEVERQTTAAQAKAAEEASKRLKDVQRATGANVRVQPKAGAATLPLGTMDDTMAEALAAIKNRSN
jgi:hypothetical protein